MSAPPPPSSPAAVAATTTTTAPPADTTRTRKSNPQPKVSAVANIAAKSSTTNSTSVPKSSTLPPAASSSSDGVPNQRGPEALAKPSADQFAGKAPPVTAQQHGSAASKREPEQVPSASLSQSIKENNARQQRDGGNNKSNLDRNIGNDPNERNNIVSTPQTKVRSRSGQVSIATPTPVEQSVVNPASAGDSSAHLQESLREQEEKDKRFVERFWNIYDDILILSIFTQVGIVFRLVSSTWFTFFGGVFSTDSALFINLPLNMFSCFVMGLLCSGERLMEIISTRFTPPRLQNSILSKKKGEEDEAKSYSFHGSDDSGDAEIDGVFRDRGAVTSIDSNSLEDEVEGTFEKSPRLRRRRGGDQQRREKRDRLQTNSSVDDFFRNWQPPANLNDELRDVQLLALERRIRASKCLVLFPVKKEDVDVMEHYFEDGYKKGHSSGDSNEDSLRHFDSYLQRSAINRGSSDLALQEGHYRSHSLTAKRSPVSLSAVETRTIQLSDDGEGMSTIELGSVKRQLQPTGDNDAQEQSQPQQIFNDVTSNVTENISRLRRVQLADGWDVGTTAEAMSDDLMLGLRVGFCGAVSSFSSWNMSMVNLLREGDIAGATMGYLLGLMMPISAYRCGQHVAVYIFVWRCRRETRTDERRGYGIRVAVDEDDEEANPEVVDEVQAEQQNENEMPSLRAVITAVFIMALVTQCTMLTFFQNPANQQAALSLLFSPLGVLARWRLSQYNAWRPSFPIGTFTANILACSLSGTLGTLLSGNPGPRERIVLVSLIAGFGGTLSSLAAFVVEILAGIDPILFRFDGAIYALLSILWAVVVGFLFEASVDWADETE